MKNDAGLKNMPRGGASPRWRSFPITLVLLFLLSVLFFWSRQYHGRLPEIHSLDPQIGFPGEILTIEGRYLGASAAEGDVFIGGEIPRRSRIKEWTPRRIVLEIPESVQSGLVVVRTALGESEGRLFTNRSRVPGLIIRGNDRVQPLIESLVPRLVAPGRILTLVGSGFGHDQGSSRILYPRQAEFLPPLPVPPENILNWTNREIRFRVPADAGEGDLQIDVRGRKSLPVTLNAVTPGVERRVGDAWSFTLKNRQVLHHPTALSGNGLYFRVPLPAEGLRQGKTELIQAVPAPLFRENRQLVFHWEELRSGEERLSEQDFMVKTASLTTILEPQRLKTSYNRQTPLYRRYTAAGPWVPSDNQYIADVAAYLCRGKTAAYEVIRRLYHYTGERLTPGSEGDEGFTREPAALLDSLVSDSAGYARLLASLLRSRGIPARLVKGVLVRGDAEKGFRGQSHEWVEAYLEEGGWLPLDAYLGDREETENFFPEEVVPPREGAAEFYFGSLSPFHIALSRGGLGGRRLTPEGRSVPRATAQGISLCCEEPWGALSGYRMDWPVPEVTGMISP